MSFTNGQSIPRRLSAMAVATTTAVICGAVVVQGWTQSGVAAGEAARPSDAFYTAVQAERGKSRFRTMCSGCHSADAASTTEKRANTVRPNGLIPIGGRALIKWENARNFFDKIRRTMPEGNPKQISPAAAVDVVAYVLQENGFPAGNEELKDSNNMMRSIMLNESGFERIFNGRNLDGFQFLIGNYCGQPPSGPPCRTEPGTTYRVEDYVLITTGAPMGIAYTTKKYLNFTLRLEYKYPPYPNMDPEEKNWGDTGYFVFLNDLKMIWPPRRLELQGGPDAALLSQSGTKATSTVDREARTRALRPVGAWNAIEIVAKAGKIMSSLNGQLVSTITDHGYTEPGSFGLQAESSEVHFRNIRIRPE